MHLAPPSMPSSLAGVIIELSILPSSHICLSNDDLKTSDRSVRRLYTTIIVKLVNGLRIGQVSHRTKLTVDYPTLYFKHEISDLSSFLCLPCTCFSFFSSPSTITAVFVVRPTKQTSVAQGFFKGGSWCWALVKTRPTVPKMTQTSTSFFLCSRFSPFSYTTTTPPCPLGA